ncbi:DUF2971 domain-containing protein [Agrobacterium tumefaciens]|uniref:DUF2971 domain-containing protein n=1 Tax=Agrobacterium tumefaciens TaxID=358 RepID=UPI0013AF1838|nr:DUF2971 domain-containing protein [Agrobacterium tumefaciens]UXT83580.1 DUF2971 domain-containing protein [Agrobacterium tumefaciens]
MNHFHNFDQTVTHVPPIAQNDRLHFFKYMSTETAKIVLRDRTLRWSKGKALNDPNDLQFDLRLNLDRRAFEEQLVVAVLENAKSPNPTADVQRIMRSISGVSPLLKIKALRSLIEDGSRLYFKQMRDRWDSVRKQSRTFNEDVKILSLTTSPLNTLMWSHYADNARGVAVRLRNNDLHSCWSEARPINYVSEIPPVFTTEELVEHCAGIKPIDGKRQFSMLLFTKSAYWAYEQEWRIAGKGRDTSKDVEDLPFLVNEVDGMIFGPNTTESDKSEIIEITKQYPQIDFAEAKRNPDGFDFILDTKSV